MLARKKRSKKGKRCFFCQSGKKPDYKKADELQQFISDRGRIVARTRTGICAKHQRQLSRQIKRARHLALLPFIARV